MTIPRLYHGASLILSPDLMGTGKLSPLGVTLHSTAGGSVASVQRSLLSVGNGYHLVVERDGKVVQFTYLDLCVSHAGNARWNGKSPNRRHIAVAISSWGKLEYDGIGYHAWPGQRIPGNAVAWRAGNVDKFVHPWEAATPAQEAALYAILKWLVSFGIDPQDICGHDECAIPIGRKSDPGGVLSKTVAEIRKSLT